MDRWKILVAEDDGAIRNLITTTLETNGYSFIAASGGEMAVMEAATQAPDIMLLDLGLPDLDGISVIKKVRGWSQMPIIVISARSEDSDKIEALDSGADDYLTKPFSVEELLARLRATARRLEAGMGNGDFSPYFENGLLRIDYAAGAVYVAGEEIHLTPIEYRLLRLMSKNAGKVLTNEFITREIWGSSWESNIGSLRVFMTTLRRKISKASESGNMIQTHVGIGYRMVKL